MERTKRLPKFQEYLDNVKEGIQKSFETEENILKGAIEKFLEGKLEQFDFKKGGKVKKFSVLTELDHDTDVLKEIERNSERGGKFDVEGDFIVTSHVKMDKLYELTINGKFKSTCTVTKSIPGDYTRQDEGGEIDKCITKPTVEVVTVHDISKKPNEEIVYSEDAKKQYHSLNWPKVERWLEDYVSNELKDV